jgi:putative endonuclease
VLPCCAMRDGHFYKYRVYIMGSLTGTLYVGMTGFFDARIGQHKCGVIEGFSKKYGCHRLLYYEGYDDVGRAKRREIQLKGWRREKKIKLIGKMNPRWEDLAEHWGQEVLAPGQPPTTPARENRARRGPGSRELP